MKHLLSHSKHIVTQSLITFHTASQPIPPRLFRIITRSLINVLIEICHNCFTGNCHKLVKLLVRIVITIITVRITVTVIITVTTFIIIIIIITIIVIAIIIIVRTIIIIVNIVIITTIMIITIIFVIPIH
ncbi:hypothetical protein ACB094_03G026200 [Castanea mollissima]